MGSSVRKTSEKIKGLLKKTVELNPSMECKEVIPQIVEETLRSKKTKNYFADKEFAVLAGCGFACFKKANEVGFDKFLLDYEVNDKKLTVIEIQKIIESILGEIEDENGEIEDGIILPAFQSAMANMLLNELTDPVEFLNIFCETFIHMLIREEVNEALISVFQNTSEEEFDKDIKEFSKKYVEENFSESIMKCNNGEIEIKELIQRLQDILSEG